jgi:hypothetical protein
VCWYIYNFVTDEERLSCKVFQIKPKTYANFLQEIDHGLDMNVEDVQK